MRVNSWKFILPFLGIFSIIVVVIGGFTVEQLIPIQLTINYSPQQFSFIKIWLKLALGLGVILPGLLLLSEVKNKPFRDSLGFYYLVLMAQLLSESLFRRWFSLSILVTIGILYTLFRIRQLWEIQQLPKTSKFSTGLVSMILLFWIANLVVILTISLPNIF